MTEPEEFISRFIRKALEDGPAHMGAEDWLGLGESWAAVRREIERLRGERNRLRTALCALLDEYDDRASQWGDDYLWGKHEDLEAVERARAAAEGVPFVPSEKLLKQATDRLERAKRRQAEFEAQGLDTTVLHVDEVEERWARLTALREGATV